MQQTSTIFITPFLAVMACVAMSAAEMVETWPLPSGAVQPRVACAADGTVHAVWLKGNPEASEVWHASRSPKSDGWRKPQRVDSGPGSAVALGMVRGAQIAVGAKDRPHIMWMGSQQAKPRAADGSAPVLYSRLTSNGFSKAINLVELGTGLDGGGAIAADATGAVWVFWHASAGATEDALRVGLVRRSGNDGVAFGPERQILSVKAGACACCEMGAVADGAGGAAVLLRVAEGNTARDQFLAVLTAANKPVAGQRLSAWKTPTCPMATASAVRVGSRTWVAWETEGQVSWSVLNGDSAGPRIDAPGASGQRKHPAIAVDATGNVCMSWVEGSGWNQAGTLHWQVWDAEGKIVGAVGSGGPLAVWSLGAVAPRPGGGFAIIR